MEVSLNHPAWLGSLLALSMAPLLSGIVNRTKALFAGRRGPPLLQAYYDLWKLLRKGAVYSRTTTWVFRAGPMVSLAAAMMLAVLTPLGGRGSAWGFSGDLILFVLLLGLSRFFTILAAWDTGSSLEGMGASRNAQFAALAEAPLLLSLTALAGHESSLSVGEIFSTITLNDWARHGAALALVAGALLAILLAENGRMPVEDPNTRLELTMIHEAMVLDHGGPDLAYILYGAALKLWCFAALLAGLLIPFHSRWWALDLGVGFLAIAGMAALVGVVESTMARLRLLVVPQLLVGAGAMGLVAFFLLAR